MKPKDRYAYRGPATEIVCQARQSQRSVERCNLPVKEYGPVRVSQSTQLMLLRCDRGHYFAVERVPAHADYHGATVYSFTPPEKAVW